MVNVEKFSRRKSVPLNRLGWWKVWRWEFKDLNVLVLTRLLSQLVLWRISRRFSRGLWGENNFSHRFQAQVISSLLLLLRNSLEFPVVVKFLVVKVKSKKVHNFQGMEKKNCTERFGGIVMAVYSKYLLTMVHRFGFWHANGKPRKEKMNTTSLDGCFQA